MNQIIETKELNSKLDTVNSTIDHERIDVWRTGSLTADNLILPVTESCVDELEHALAHSAPDEKLNTLDQNKFKQCRELARELVRRLDAPDLGAAIVDGLPADRYNEEENRRLCSVFASLIGDLMEQNKDGITLYDVKNKNPKDPSKVRKSITNQAQPYHTDGGWHRTPAHYVGLYCVRNAKSGGGSKITSMLTAFEAMQAYPEYLDTLLDFHPWDMQGEHAPHESGIQLNPVFEVSNGRFVSRYYDSYIRGGYKKGGQPVPEELDTALRCLETIINDQPCIRFEMTSGQFQYLNNWTVLHAREAFADTITTPEHETRHVIRVWNH